MAGSQTLAFDILGNASSAARAFKDTADSAALAARGATMASDAMKLQAKSAEVSAGATLALARADRLAADAERELARDAAVATAVLGKQNAALLGSATAGAVGSMLAAAASGKAPSGGGSGSGVAPGIAMAAAAMGIASRNSQQLGRSVSGANAAAAAAVPIWKATVGGIALWHIALDGALEAGIALTSGLAALAVGGAAMAATAQDIYTQMKSVAAVNSALGSSIPPLTGHFQDLQAAMAPQTIEAFGGALNLVNGNSGVLASVAGQVVTGIDNLVARIDIWNASQAHSGKLLQDGVGFLTQFEQILGNVGGALDHLAKADPGTAHMLLDVVNAGAKLLNVATSIPTPLLAAALSLHSVYTWGNFAGGALGKLAGLVPGLSKVSDALSHGFHLSSLASPQALGIVALVAAVADIAVNWDKADASARSYIADMNAQLSNMPASQAITALSEDIGQLNEKIKTAFSPQSMQQIAATWNTLANTGQSFAADFKADVHDWAKFWGDLGTSNYKTGLADLGHAIAGVFAPGQGQAVVAANNAAAYKAQIDKLLGSQANLAAETGSLVKSGYSMSQAFAVMDLAGVRADDSFALMQAKVTNLITGYKNMSVSGGLLANSVEAVTFASLQQSSKVSELNSAWDSFITTISGGVTGLDAFETDLAKLDKSAGISARNLGLLSAGTIAAQQNFTQSASSANSEMDALTTLASAAGLGSKGTGLLTRANKDLVAALLPAAKGSSSLTTILYALAQRGGYQGADSFQALSRWVGNTKAPMKDLTGVTAVLTKAAGNLTTDVQNLSTALGQTLNNAMAQVILTESGGLKPMENLYKAIRTTGLDSGTTARAALGLAGQYYALTGSVRTARDEFVVFAEHALHLTQQQADTLWQHTLPRLQAEINSLHGKTVPVEVIASGTGGVRVVAPGQAARTWDLQHLAAGGFVSGGTPGKDSVPALLMPGEVVVPKQMVAGGAVDHLRGALPGFAGGGLVQLPGWVSDQAGSTIGGWAGAATQSILNALISQYKSTLGAPGAGNAVTRWAPDILRVLAMLRQDSSNLGPVEHRIQVESGGNPNAINLWDVNAKNGDPSRGLMQVIGATFARYRSFALPNDIYNPLSNIYAGINYAVNAYAPRSLASVMLQAGGYDSGGYLPTGWSLAYNGTGRPEPVIPAGRHGGGDVHVHLHNHGVIGSRAELDSWLTDSVERIARKGKLRWTLQQSPSARG